MRFTPKTEDEIALDGLLEEGLYSFEVVKAEDKLSKKGNEMIELTLKVWDNNGNPRTVFDYLLESMSFKLKHFCDAVGLAHKYADGTLSAEHCTGKSAKAYLIVQPAKDGYGPKNSVRDYQIAVVNDNPATNTIVDDDLPF